MLAAKVMVNPTEAKRSLERVLSSRVFAKAERSRRFLRYLVDAALSQPPISVKEYTVAMDVFDRDTSYDPSIDATVRVEASRLRARLREYYDGEGREEALVIEVPKGGYAAVLHKRVTTEPARAERPTANLEQEASREPMPEMVTAAWSTRRRGGWGEVWIAACGLLLVLIAVTLGVGASRGRPARGSAKPSTQSLAILPIVNRTGDAELDYLCDGLTDDVIRQLSQLPALKLIARTVAFHYRQPTANPLEVGKALEVGAVMTSELRRTSDHLSLEAVMKFEPS